MSIEKEGRKGPGAKFGTLKLFCPGDLLPHPIPLPGVELSMLKAPSFPLLTSFSSAVVLKVWGH